MAWDMLTRNGARRTYTHWYNTQEEAERLYQQKRQAFSTIEIWLIRSEIVASATGEILTNYEYIHKPEYVWR